MTDHRSLTAHDHPLHMNPQPGLDVPSRAPSPVSVAPTRVRHIVLALTIAVYLITYMDRVAISAAVPSIQKQFGFSLVTMGWILGAFQWSYAIFQIPVAWLGDRF